MRCFWEDAVLNLIDRFTALQRDTAEERYLDLLSKPAYMQKIPQKYLASFHWGYADFVEQDQEAYQVVIGDLVICDLVIRCPSAS